MSCHVTSSCHVMSCDFVHQKKLSCWKKGTKAVKLVETLSLRRKKKRKKKRTSYSEKKISDGELASPACVLKTVFKSRTEMSLASKLNSLVIMEKPLRNFKFNRHLSSFGLILLKVILSCFCCCFTL